MLSNLASQLLRRRAQIIAAAAAAVVSLSGFAIQSSHATTVTAGADAEIRESTPEFTRGAVATSGTTQFELTLNNSPLGNSNRNVDLVRFTLPNTIQTAADLQNYAELRIFLRSTNTTGGQNGGVRVYGLNPANTYNTAWDETNVFYRDTGSHQLVTPLQGGPQSLQTPSVLTQVTNPASTAAGAPVEPIHGTAGYGANANDTRHAPGIRYEAAPFSQQVESENVARYNYNVGVYNNFVANGTSGTYLSYLAQPGYSVALQDGTTSANNSTVLAAYTGGTPAANSALSGPGAGTASAQGYSKGVWSDVANTNRPYYSGSTQSWVDDVEDSTYLGFSRLNVPSTGNYEGQYLSFGTNGGLSGSLPLTDAQADEAALIAYLTSGLANGYHTFTFLVGSSILSTNPDEIQNNLNLNFASKEYTPVNTALGGQGALAAQLLVAPEPGACTAMLCLAGMALRRRSRSRSR